MEPTSDKAELTTNQGTFKENAENRFLFWNKGEALNGDLCATACPFPGG
jgi:hypothetical protein